VKVKLLGQNLSKPGDMFKKPNKAAFKGCQGLPFRFAQEKIVQLNHAATTTIIIIITTTSPTTTMTLFFSAS